jgi:hypothetical protein
MGAERLFWRRARWRLRGAWQWPVYVVLTVADGVMLARLPFTGDGTAGVVPGLLIAGFANLLAVAVVAPLAGRRLRRRRPDLPRLVANDYAGTVALTCVSLALLAGGILHRPARNAERAELAAVAATTHDYVASREPAYRAGLANIDAMRVEDELYRSCVPGDDPQRWLCLFVTTDQRPPGVTEDPDRAPNAVYRSHGGFR